MSKLFIFEYLFRLFIIIPLPIGELQISLKFNNSPNINKHFLECNFLIAFASLSLTYSLDLPKISPTSSKVLDSPSSNPNLHRIISAS